MDVYGDAAVVGSRWRGTGTYEGEPIRDDQRCELGGSGSSRYAMAAIVSWPLLDLGHVKAGVDAARADEAEARARYQAAVLAALEEVESALSAYRGAWARLKHLEDAAAASERATDIARWRYEEGATGFLEVLDAERRQLESQDALSAGYTDIANALVDVYRAQGGGVALAEGS